MGNTSEGFHTVTIYKKLSTKAAKKLIMDFESYGERTGEIKFTPLRKGKAPDNADDFVKWLYSSFPKYYIASYNSQNKGILWLLRYSNYSPGFIKPGDVDKPCSIKATINPKILIGENDYLAAATANYLEGVESLFNTETEKISPVLGEYRSYAINRPDYCINFDLDELAIPCTPEQMIYLIKRGNIPRHYTERTEYNEISKRKKSDKNSFYLESNSVIINCYWKYMQLSAEFQNCPSFTASRNLIRFEIQCKYLKTYYLSKKIKNKPEMSNSDVIREMLSEDFCAEIIRDYFDKVIRRGDYFTLDGAIKMVQSYHFCRNKEARIIGELQRINQFRGIHKVTATLDKKEFNTFRRTLGDLAEINVNPVTIPKDWNIPRIPSLLDAYEKMVEAERLKKGEEEIRLQILKDYYSDKGNRKKIKKY